MAKLESSKRIVSKIYMLHVHVSFFFFTQWVNPCKHKLARMVIHGSSLQKAPVTTKLQQNTTSRSAVLGRSFIKRSAEPLIQVSVWISHSYITKPITISISSVDYTKSIWSEKPLSLACYKNIEQISVLLCTFIKTDKTLNSLRSFLKDQEPCPHIYLPLQDKYKMHFSCNQVFCS